MRPRHLSRLLLCLAMAPAAPAAAQLVPAPLPRVVPDLAAGDAGSARGTAQESDGIGFGFLASAVLPGAAQFRAGDGRWVPYAATEAWAWVSYFQKQRAARSAERRYRDLAWQVARRVSVGERRDSVFEYYEAMASDLYPASGSFDVEPNVPGTQPEPQLNTFNGRVWELARELHFAGGATPGTPQYNAALAYYEQHAIPASYAWAWGASNLEQQVFANLIAESDAAYRSATRYLGVILANHVASAVDALVTARLRQLGAGSARFRSGPLRDGHGARWEYGVEIRF